MNRFLVFSLVVLMLVAMLAGCKAKEQDGVMDESSLLDRKASKFTSADTGIEIQASSTNSKYPLANLMDGKDNTAWVAGNQGSGAGEYLMINFASPRQVGVLKLVPGYNKNNDIWFANNRLQEIELEFSDGSTQRAGFDGSQRSYRINIGKAGVQWIRLNILQTYPGERWADTCISELGFE